MSVVHLRGSGWHWRSLWRFTFLENGDVVRVWAGQEILVDEDGEHLRRQPDGRITTEHRGDLIQRSACPPDRLVPSDEEMRANRERRR